MNVFEMASIPPGVWDMCYISDDGLIYTPIFDDDGNIVKTGKQMYYKIHIQS